MNDTNMENQIDLSRFKEGYRRSFQTALREIKEGKKRSHWMWYIFPQMQELGRSPTSRYYGIYGLAEAKAFLDDPYLGEHLKTLCRAFLNLDETDPIAVFGNTDGKKMRSCMTLFSFISEEGSVFHQVLDRYYNGKMDQRTLSILGIRE